MESGFVMYVCNIKLCLEAYTFPTHLQKEPNFVMYVHMYITQYSFVLKLIQPQNIANGMMINFHSMEYYFQWHLSQCSDSLEAGLYAVCFLAEATALLSIHNIRPAIGTSGLLFSGCYVSFPSVAAADA